MPEYIRVRDKATGHEYTVTAARFDDASHTRLDRPALDAHGEPAAPKYRTSATKKAAAKKTASKAETEKE